MKSLAPVLWVFLSVGVVSTAAEPGVSSELERTAATSPDEKRSYARDANTEMSDNVNQLIELLAGAERDGNSSGKDCIKDALTSARTVLQFSQSAETKMKEALMSGEGDRADHEFRKIAVGLSKSRQIVAEGERCAYGDDVRPGQTSVKWTGGLTEEGDDTHGLTLDEFDLGYDPPDVSPF